MESTNAVTLDRKQQKPKNQKGKQNIKRRKKLQIMTPDHPDWVAFYFMLLGTLGNDIPGKCDGSFDNAKALLKTFPGIEVEASLGFFETQGGFCDCEVVLNVDKETPANA